MKRDRLLRGVFLVFALAAASWQGAAWGQGSELFSEEERAWIASHPVINVAIDEDWRPLEYVENGEYRGLSAEYLRAISRISGLQFRWTVYDGWAAARDAVINGSADVLPATSERMASPQLRKLIRYSKPYFVGSTLIVTQASAPVMFDPRQLSGKTVAVKAGGGYERNLRFRYPDIQLVQVDSPIEALEQVADGSVYAVVDIDAALIPVLQQRYFDTLHVAGSIADMPGIASIGVRVENAMLSTIIDKSLAALTARETDQMMARWVDATSYGPPTWSAMMKFYYRELFAGIAFILIFLLLLFRAHSSRRLAQRSERDKAMLLAVISHEIRTPMNAILSSVELLGRAELRPEDAQLAQVAVTSANTLLELLDSVLDFSRLEAQKLQIQLRPTNIQPLIKDAVSIAEFRAQEKNLPLKTQVDWDAPLWLNVDALRVRQVLINLLSNAIKFTETGEVRIAASFATAADDATRGVLRIMVSDTGIGVSKREQQRLFHAFAQADESVTRKFGGTGLGLTICRQLLFLMGGKVELQSELGKGTTIEVLLPATLAEPQPTEALVDVFGRQTGPVVDQKLLRVLVIEDHPESQFVIDRQMQILGLHTTQALSGQLGIDLFTQESFDIILLDCNLPDIDGYTVARRIREVERTSGTHTPIIAISAMVGPEHTEACFEAGIDGILRKPLRIEQLREMIELWCDVQSSTPTAAQPQADDEDVLIAFAKTSAIDLEQILAAAAVGNWSQVSRLAHRVAGAGMMLDVPEVVSTARHLEALAKDAPADAAVPVAIERLQHALSTSLP